MKFKTLVRVIIVFSKLFGDVVYTHISDVEDEVTDCITWQFKRARFDYDCPQTALKYRRY